MAVIDSKTNESYLSMDTDDNIYYNIRIANFSGKRMRATYYENRTEPIIYNPSLYELSVIRFKIPSQTIPIFIWDLVDPFYLTLSYDGVDVSKPLVYIGDYTPEEDAQLYGPAVWSFQTFMDMINNALSLAFNELKILKPLAPPTTPPIFSYSAATQSATVNCEKLYDDSTNTIGIYIDYNTFSSIGGFQLSSNAPYMQPPVNPLKYKRFRIKDNFVNNIVVNGNDWYTFPQEYNSTNILSDITAISLQTDNIPVNAEYLPGNNNTRKILTDFEPIEGDVSSDSYQFFPQGPLRYYDLLSNYPLRTIDLKLYWVNKSGNEYPIYVESGNLVTLKIQFRKKNTLMIKHIGKANIEDY